ncbi:MAG TPA: hypothetical protein VL330_11995, partial [Actinomycetes bacterium]|nr:hypothetical protein [Actinomycetes bacterium]
MAVLALVLVLAAACSAGPDEKPSDRVCDDTACISAVKLGQGLDRQLQGHVVGYVVLVGSSQVFASGQARKDSDPPSLPMGPEVVVNVASVGKLFTTIAVLKSLAGHGRSIDTKIQPFLPRTGSKGHTSTPSPLVSSSPTRRDSAMTAAGSSRPTPLPRSRSASAS